MENYEVDPKERYVTIFKALSDMTRLKIMWLLLSMDSKIYVSEIVDVLGENQYNVSKHLKILEQAGLIFKKREGRWNFYHYINNYNEFDAFIRQTVLTIPRELMAEEASRCEKRLDMRVDDKCVIGSESGQFIR
ncbi:ArsR/SmtB family transcription factor [Paenibacillus paeoniae]|uniref:ArsR family transcriptional regulator n=1 Tax=Paenibacillus paeoniae TaxID=2292705 RepID=A0A371PHH0_9BACL|nr:metalloregulator ArsR/SmtB family transcription factor [Paenibacillus paeoniae]REK75584.1 ArsR family transcriptional regulator [Paenibacillus paeoniae]